MLDGIMRPYIESQIAAKRAELENLNRQRLTVETELRVYEQMLSKLDAEEPPNPIKHEPKANGSSDRVGHVPAEMTDSWKRILVSLSALNRHFDAREVVLASEGIGHPTKMMNARGQLYQWDKKGIIVRVRKGKYKLTTKGSELVKKFEGSGASAPEPSEDRG